MALSPAVTCADARRFQRGNLGYLRRIPYLDGERVTTAEQPAPEGDDQPPQATEDEGGSDADSAEPSRSPGSDAPPAGE
ncbi:hypothetical protein [Mycobacterium colombiense]|uniref:hypothetical protein n=1 Tax=Mycobacterium colombiense TaxID=339268 RepID=UPI0012DB14A1|nr:hypothetical protein [Mycobacterium colombiense]